VSVLDDAKHQRTKSNKMRIENMLPYILGYGVRKNRKTIASWITEKHKNITQPELVTYVRENERKKPVKHKQWEVEEENFIELLEMVVPYYKNISESYSEIREVKDLVMDLSGRVDDPFLTEIGKILDDIEAKMREVVVLRKSNKQESV